MRSIYHWKYRHHLLNTPSIPSKTMEGSHGMELRNMRFVWATTRRSTSMLETCTRYAPPPFPAYYIDVSSTFTTLLRSLHGCRAQYGGLLATGDDILGAKAISKIPSSPVQRSGSGTGRPTVPITSKLDGWWSFLSICLWNSPSLTLFWSFSFRFVCS